MKRNNLKIEIWKYLMIFSCIILVFLWIFQILFLDQYYEFEKTKDLKEVASKIEHAKTEEKLLKIINYSAYDKNICVEITNYENTLYSSTYLSRGCLKGNESHVNYKEDFINSNLNKTTYEILNPTFQNKTLVYALKLKNGLYAFINTSLEPIDSTVTILKNQLIYVTLIVLVLSFTIAYFISKHISKPIVEMSYSAKKLAEGNFDTLFNTDSNIEEINELAETLNRAKEELAKTEELRRDLMANISHDLKTPLTMIKAYAEMSKDLHSNDKKKREKNLSIIIEESDRLTALVNDILILSSMQSETEKLHFSTFDLNKLIKTILKRYEIFRETENYHFIYNNKKKLEITADQKKMEQVIYNLINNAINYTGNDKMITINIIEKEETIRVEIMNTGVGIEKNDLPYIWDKYYKNHKNHKRSLMGTGLGLSIVKSILELHHYQYGVISKKNQTTTFYFEIKR